MHSLLDNPNGSWTLTPEMAAALEAANAQLAQQANAFAPTMQAVAAPTLARELIAWGRIELSTSGERLLRELPAEASSQTLFRALYDSDCLADARRVLAMALPKRRALWWGTIAAYDAYGDQLQGILPIVTRFVATGDEDARRAAGELALRAPSGSVASLLATAAFHSAGSLTPPGMPPVAPPPFITGRLVGACVYLAAVTRDPARYQDYLRRYLDWGLAIAAGKIAFPTAPLQPEAPARDVLSRRETHLSSNRLYRSDEVFA